MTWFRVDDGLHSHPKRLAAGVEAMGLWVVAGTYTAAYLTDGVVERDVAASLDPKWKTHAAALVRAEFWHAPGHECPAGCAQPPEGGWIFHEWWERQPSRADVEAARKATAERVAKWREKRRHEHDSEEDENAGVTPLRRRK